MKRFLPFGIIVVVLFITAATGMFLYQTRRAPQSAEQQPQQKQSAPAAGKPGATPAHVRGPANAPVALEEFGDFECMPCFMLWPVLQNVKKDYGDRMSITFRQHPLSNHRHARDAARATEAAGLQGKFWEMHDSLYQNRAVWLRGLEVRSYFATYATYLGLDVDRFKKDMDSEEVNRRIAADEERGASLKIDRTPVILVNGEQITFSADPDKDIREAIDKALAGKATP
jgi:protein-disulfide isomerase